MARNRVWATPLVAGAGLLAYTILWPDKHAAKPPEMEPTSAEQQQESLRRSPDVQRITPDASLEQAEAAADYGFDFSACLRSKDIRACLTGAPIAELNPQQIAEFLRDEQSYSLVARVELLRAFVLKMPAGEVASTIDELGDLVDERVHRKMATLVEGVFLGLLDDMPLFAEQVAFSLTPVDLFSGASSSACVSMARVLSDKYPALLSMLDEGAIGTWGGTERAVDEAFLFRALDRESDPASLLEFIDSAIDSPYLETRAQQFIGTSMFVVLDSLGKRDEGLSDDVGARLIRLLSDRELGQGLAVQYRADYGAEVLPYLSPESQQLVLLEVQRVLRRR